MSNHSRATPAAPARSYQTPSHTSQGLPWRPLWNRLVEPRYPIVDYDDYRRARLLSGLLLVLIAGNLFFAPIIVSRVHPTVPLWRNPLFFGTLTSLLVCSAAYLLSRTGYYHLSAAATIAILTVVTYLGLLTVPTAANLQLTAFFISLTILLSSMLFPLTTTIAIALAHCIGLVALPLLVLGFAADSIVLPITSYVNFLLFFYILLRHNHSLSTHRQGALEHVLENMQAIFDAFPDLLFRVDRQGTIREIRAGDRSDLYMPPEQFLHQPLDKVLPSDIYALFQQAIARSRELHTVINVEYSLPIHGDIKWFEARVVPMATDHFTIIVRNISEQKQAQDGLRASEERFRELADNLREVFWLFDWREQRVLYASPAYATIWGRSVQDLYANYDEWATSIHPDDRLTAAEEFSQSIEIGGGDRREYRIVRPDGGVRWIADTGFVIRDDQGEIVHVAGIAEDITARRRNEAERERLITELEAKNNELERFTYTVSHDLKSPLVTIKGFLGYLEQHARDGNADALLGDIRRIDGAAQRMQTLLDDLLELSRIGRIVNPPEEIAFETLVQEAMGTLAGQLEASNVVFVIEPDLPVVYGDHTRLLQVLENLLDNAVKFIGEQPQPTIEIGAYPAHESAQLLPREIDAHQQVFYVRDNGPGIDPRYHDRIFGLFDKLDSTTAGSGIGLAIVQRIVQVHGGRIWIRSGGADKGSEFCFSLPVAIEADQGKERDL